MNIPEIKDKYFVTYGIFYLMGILTYVPYYFFTTANDFWMFKFRDPMRDHVPDNGPPHRTPLQVNFTSSFSIVCQVSLMGAYIVAAFFSKRLPPPEKRIFGALSCTLVFFIVNLCFVPINTDTFQEAFFVIILLIAVLVNINSAITMISLFELVTKFPLGYYSAILSGQALCGIFSAITQIVTLSVDSRSIINGFVYFGIGTTIVALTLTFYYISRKNSKYFIYHIGNGIQNSSGPTTPYFRYDKVRSALNETKWYMSSLVFVTGSTAMVYPGVIALIVPIGTGEDTNNKWTSVYFIPVINFFLFNLFDFIGRELAGRIKWPACSAVIMILAIMRIGLVPLLLLCNAQPRKYMPVVFGDAAYIIILIFFSASHGFLVNLCIVTIPSCVEGEEQKQFITILTLLFSVITSALCSFLTLMLLSFL